MTGWWLSEKMDGIRAYWNGKKLYSKKGNEIKAPKYFTQELPKTALDGELWVGRRTFEILMGLQNSSDWKNIKYVVFDLPDSTEPIEKRIEMLKIARLPHHISVAEFHRCEGSDHLKRMLEDIVSQGGEGIMAYKPNSCYTIGRTNSLLKVKVKSNIEIDKTAIRRL